MQSRLFLAALEVLTEAEICGYSVPGHDRPLRLDLAEHAEHAGRVVAGDVAGVGFAVSVVDEFVAGPRVDTFFLG